MDEDGGNAAMLTQVSVWKKRNGLERVHIKLEGVLKVGNETKFVRALQFQRLFLQVRTTRAEYEGAVAAV
ncbi:hypothetical protein RchiOBHm_Chr1g0341661 [Rosa chinensis]|uniref:Uncharacterized protein n=1 Tax=Rosa chinensis TaxID=74649 RepID=A0A2P6SDT3_ROSCH|nr:hypothetical protein RchiOBHm_Chr1g0341661 [Rosa chinensis]